WDVHSGSSPERGSGCTPLPAPAAWPTPSPPTGCATGPARSGSGPGCSPRRSSRAARRRKPSCGSGSGWCLMADRSSRPGPGAPPPPLTTSRRSDA
ncbi:MAG: hypothetical protein AVDCRST_MAG32-1685, partial [uncultured Nocardioides sp.]